VVLGSQWDLTHPLNDSKQLTPEERERLFSIIRKEAQGHKIIVVSAQAIDESNILAATLQAMAASLDGLTPRPDYALIDGNRYPPTELPGETVVKGDARSLSIAAASILAKVVHDRLMRVYARRYPQWGFDRHLGYPTREHRQAIQAHGLSPIHRKTFRSRPRPEQLSLL
jgi:ribonuclease HII